MENGWQIKRIGSIDSLVCSHIPFAHGFLGKNSPLTIEDLASSLDFKGGTVALKQTHSINCAEVTGRTSEALFFEDCDGVIFRRNGSEKVMAAIKTADCMPVIAWNEEWVALLHIGWRGAANRFLSKVVGDERFFLAIGPHACRDKYNIGEDILQEFSLVAVLTDPLRLSLAETVQLGMGDKIASSYISPVCTMQDEKYHSHRRDGDRAGRNYSFVIF